tara:strand:- start:4587 stop:5285 length:699 start_codon:yes stop_codon:yes gene_type:complete
MTQVYPIDNKKNNEQLEEISKNIINDIFKSVITEMKYKDLKTGDLLFFTDNKTWYNRLIEWATNSEYCHIGMVLKNPVLFNKSYDGLYVIHSTSPELLDVEDHKHKLGVQITKLEDTLDMYESVHIRHLNVDRNGDFMENLKSAHKEVHDVPYDFGPRSWFVSAFYHLGIWDHKVKRHTNAYWCSSLVGYIYVKLGILDKDFDWSNWAPCDFAGNLFKLEGGSELSDIKLLK